MDVDLVVVLQTGSGHKYQVVAVRRDQRRVPVSHSRTSVSGCFHMAASLQVLARSLDATDSLSLSLSVRTAGTVYWPSQTAARNAADHDETDCNTVGRVGRQTAVNSG